MRCFAQVVDQITGQANAVGIVTGEIAVGQKNHRIDRFGIFRAWAALVAEFPNALLERNGDIKTAKSLLL